MRVTPPPRLQGRPLGGYARGLLGEARTMSNLTLNSRTAFTELPVVPFLCSGIASSYGCLLSGLDVTYGYVA